MPPEYLFIISCSPCFGKSSIFLIRKPTLLTSLLSICQKLKKVKNTIFRTDCNISRITINNDVSSAACMPVFLSI